MEDALKAREFLRPKSKAGEILFPAPIKKPTCGGVPFLAKGVQTGLEAMTPVPGGQLAGLPAGTARVPPTDAGNSSLIKSWLSQASCHVHEFHAHTKA